MFEHFSSGDAVQYDNYARSGLRYRLGAEGILRAAGDLSDALVGDVACGTGLLTERLLTAVGPRGRVLAIDHSEAMLRVARARTRDSRVGFVRCAAETLGDIVHECLDVICCNAAFWLFDSNRALATFRRALTSGGTLVFNLSERALPWTKDLPATGGEWFGRPMLRRRTVLDECVRLGRDRYPGRDFSTRYPQPMVARPELTAKLEEAGFAVRGVDVVPYAIPRDDEFLWLQLDAWEGHPLDALDPCERHDILQEVFAGIPPDGIFAAQWFTVSAELRDRRMT